MNNKVIGLFLNRANSKFVAIFGGQKIAISGIQRSGTNYLAACLKQLGITPLNYFRVGEAHAMHKHSRWNCISYCKIPRLKELYPEIKCDNIQELNTACGYPIDTCHLIIQKDKANWLLSAANFALFSGWYPDEKSVLQGLSTLSDDYDEYYNFWSKMSKKDSRKCRIVVYENILNDFECLVSQLIYMEFNIRLLDEIEYGKFTELNMSPLTRRKKITAAMLSGYID